MKRLLIAMLLGLSIGVVAQGPLTPIGQLQGRTDSNGALYVTSAAETLPQGPLTPIANLRGRTDSNGYLYVTLAGGSGACTLGVTQVAFGDATTAACIGDSGLTYNQTQNTLALSPAMTGTAFQVGFNMTGTYAPTGAATSGHYNFYNSLTISTANNIGNGYGGIYSEVIDARTGGTSGGLYGAEIYASRTGAASAASTMGGLFAQASHSGTAASSTLVGLDTNLVKSGSGTISTAMFGLRATVRNTGSSLNPLMEGVDVTANGADTTGSTEVYGGAFNATGGKANTMGLNVSSLTTSAATAAVKGIYVGADTGSSNTVTGGIYGIDILARTQSSGSNQVIGLNIAATDTGSASPTVYGAKVNTTGSGTLYGLYSDGDAGLKNYVFGLTELANDAALAVTGQNETLLIANGDEDLGQLGILNTTYSTSHANGIQLYQYNNGTAEMTAPTTLLLTAVGTTITTTNTVNNLTLTTPTNTSATYDTTPLAAIYIDTPASPSTRNFISGIWVITNGASTDKGRGIAVQNNGASDSFYAQQDGSGATGYAALTNNTGIGLVSDTAAAGAVAGAFRQATGGGASVVGKFEGNIAGAAELVQFNANQTGKTGIVYRMSGAGNSAIIVKDAGNNNVFQLTADTGEIIAATVTSNDWVKGRYIATGSTPSVSDTSANSCGTGTETIVGTNNAGKVTVIGSAGTSCTVTFTTAWANAPSCTVTNETTANLSRATSTTTTVILAGVFAQNDVLAYVCIGR